MSAHELTFERDAYAARWSCSCGWVGEWGRPGSAGADAVRHARDEAVE